MSIDSSSPPCDVVLAAEPRNCTIPGCPCASGMVLVFLLRPEPDGPGMPPRRRSNTYTTCSRHSPNDDIVRASGSKFLEFACRKKCAAESPDRRLAMEYSDVPLSHPLTSITHVLPATHRNTWCDVSFGAMTTARVVSVTVSATWATVPWFALASRPTPEGGEHDGGGRTRRRRRPVIAAHRSRRRPSPSDHVWCAPSSTASTAASTPQLHCAAIQAQRDVSAVITLMSISSTMECPVIDN